MADTRVPVVSKPFVFGHCVTGHCHNCPGGIRQPDLPPKYGKDGTIVREAQTNRDVYCTHECHEGQEIALPDPTIVTREVVPGKRDRKLADQLGDAIESEGFVSIDAPEDERELTNAKQRLYNAARKRSLKVRVYLEDGKLIASLKGETRKQSQQERQDMKVTGFTGELPKREGVGRVRKPNPFDEHIAKGGTHKVTLEKGDDVATIKRQLQNAATFGNKSVNTFHDTTDGAHGSLLFEVVPRRTRNTKKGEK